MRSVAVLGAGTMGAQIAAHLANAGVPVVLLDLDAKVARDGFERARKLKPDPFFTSDAAALVTTGGFDTDLGRLKNCDWIIEAIVERLDLKKSLLEKVEANRVPGSIVSSNTSGIPIAAMAEGRSDEFRRHWLGTHFFNPPRYLKLLEIIPTPETDPDVMRRMAYFADVRLGKGVVVAKDTPNFIANHIGMFGMLRVLDALGTGEYTIEEIDSMTGPALGRPKSATFRTAHIAGVDVMYHVIKNLADRITDESVRAAFVMPPIVEELVKRGWVGEKAGQGFYKRVKGAGGKSDILTLDPKTFEYRPQQKAKLGPIEAGKSIENLEERVKLLFLGKDNVGEYMRRTLGATLVYTARVAPDIAHSIDDVDRAMRWGFGWERGPFELWDAVGVREVLEACKVSDVPPVVKDCVVLDLRLPGMSGFDLIERIKADPQHRRLPVIVYTGRELTDDDRERLQGLAQTVIIKDVTTMERLLDETALFLHRVETDLPERKQRVLRRLAKHDPQLVERTVLVVDEDLRNIFALTSLLESHKMNMIYAENGKRALTKLEENPTVDVVLMDIMMPEMDGYEALRKIRERPEWKNLPVIALTAKAMKGDRTKCLQAGASDYITKPVASDQLLSLLRVWLYGS